MWFMMSHHCTWLVFDWERLHAAIIFCALLTKIAAKAAPTGFFPFSIAEGEFKEVKPSPSQ